MGNRRDLSGGSLTSPSRKDENSTGLRFPLFAGSFYRTTSFLQLISNRIVYQTVGFDCHGFVGEYHGPKARFVLGVPIGIGHHHLEVWKQVRECLWFKFSILKIEDDMAQI